MHKPPSWTIEEALQLIRELQTKALHKGYHLALGGGVLNRGFSHNDLDIVALPLDNVTPISPTKLAEIITPYLGSMNYSTPPLTTSVGTQGSEKVFSYSDGMGRKIDLLFYTRTGM